MHGLQVRGLQVQPVSAIFFDEAEMRADVPANPPLWAGGTLACVLASVRMSCKTSEAGQLSLIHI